MNPVKECFERQFKAHDRFCQYGWAELMAWLSAFDGYELIKKEPEIARCKCRDAFKSIILTLQDRRVRITCFDMNCFQGPICETLEEAIKRWNEVMGR